MSFEIGRKQYASMYGPTTGDSIRLADTELFIRIEKDYTTYRAKAYGKRLDIAAGTAVRFEPGDEKEIRLIDIAGNRKVYGLNDKVNGALDLEEKWALK